MEYISQAIIDRHLEVTTLEQGAGIIYFGSEHFTAQIVDDAMKMWYHDGITMKRSCTYEGDLSSLSDQEMWFKEGRRASSLIYSHV
ncbi:hypothetical protein K439DRAFT_1371708 [Ramaria rubella]|nr:hypothetical protein K439DRAFT_1371708 [Ramaria rubella]